MSSSSHVKKLDNESNKLKENVYVYKKTIFYLEK